MSKVKQILQDYTGGVSKLEKPEPLSTLRRFK